MLLSFLVATGTSASGEGVREIAAAELVTYEVAPQEAVVRELAPPVAASRKRASNKSVRQVVVNEDSVSLQGGISLQDSVSLQGSELAQFLDRLMLAESGGRDTAANPLSTALGPFQFIKSTFLDIARRHFAREVADLSDHQVLGLRTTRHFARSAAAAFTFENAAHLKGLGHEATWPHLRLAFLLGPTGAGRVLQAAPDTPLSQVLAASVLQANPFMNGMTATALIARAAREVAAREPAASAQGEPTALPRPEARARPSARTRPGTPGPAAKPEGGAVASVKIRCNQKLVSCQRWVALQKLKQKTRNAQGAPGKGVKG